MKRVHRPTPAVPGQTVASGRASPSPKTPGSASERLLALATAIADPARRDERKELTIQYLEEGERAGKSREQLLLDLVPFLLDAKISGLPGAGGTSRPGASGRRVPRKPDLDGLDDTYSG